MLSNKYTHVSSLKLTECTSKNEWDIYFNKALEKNLSQDWDYGTFRAMNKNIKVKRYKIFESDNVFAIFQIYILKIKYIPYLKIAYLNRGPLLLNEISTDKFVEIVCLIKKKFSIFNYTLFYFNPFFSIDSSYFASLERINFTKRFTTFYYTTCINLTFSIELLRKNLHSKWRNQLTTAEKKIKNIKIDELGEYDDFIISSYREMASIKDFKTLTDSQILDLLKSYRSNEKLFVLLALDENDSPFAFTISLGFADHAVYLIGWVSNESRSLNPTNLLLWNTIVLLQNKKYKNFDLGGMDPTMLPGIARFKRGIGGQEFIYKEKYFSII